ncbi:hypothetical protein F0562_033759 [Nyssa sinensis]|uniref:Pentatricopeptide repeat-containing protein n=1 Tax=Nyssa sinensis TaxID=561372 RepID=A0A5J5AHU2_9ASTE|nr:hypothetical protein F0562_033759 [Nyssa sinensis]
MSCFEKMGQKYGLTPEVEHYGCMIDLLGRAGMLDTAHKLINSLPVKGDATAWRALLAACRVHGNVGLGGYVKKVLEEIYEQHPADSLALSSTYAIAGRLPDHTSMMETKEGKLSKEDDCMLIGKEEKMMKEAGCSTIELEENKGLHCVQRREDAIIIDMIEERSSN